VDLLQELRIERSKPRVQRLVLPLTDLPNGQKRKREGHFSQTSNLAGFAETPPNLLGFFCRQKRSRAKRHTGEGHLPFCTNNQRLDLGVFRGASIIADR